MVCLDTTVLVDLLRPKKSQHRQTAEFRIACLSLAGTFLFTTRVNVAEILVGAYRGADPPNELLRIEQILRPISVLELDERSADQFSQIKAEALRSGRPVGDADLLIAAIAQVNRCSLLTRNPRDFNNVIGLQVEIY